MRKYLAEFIGTFVLVFVGTGTVVIGKGDLLAIALAFGLSVTVMAFAVGGISGGHFNPGVTVAMMLNKRLDVKDGIFYIVAQALGSIVASAVLSIYIHALGLVKDGFGQTDFTKLSAIQAFGIETLATFIFVLVILMVTSTKYGNAVFAPVAIGITLSLMIMVLLNLTGASLNAARSLGPALFAGGSGLAHYWVYLIAPTLGAAIAAFVGRILGSEDK